MTGLCNLHLILDMRKVILFTFFLLSEMDERGNNEESLSYRIEQLERGIISYTLFITMMNPVCYLIYF